MGQVHVAVDLAARPNNLVPVEKVIAGEQAPATAELNYTQKRNTSVHAYDSSRTYPFMEENHGCIPAFAEKAFPELA